VAGSYTWRGGESKLAVIQDGPRRALLADSQEQPFEEYIGRLGLVDLTAGRMEVLRGGPDERRRFLDRGILGVQPSFLLVIGEYRRVRAQRNALLRGLLSSGARTGTRELDAWDQRLSQAAGQLHRKRREYTLLLSSCLGEPARRIYREETDLLIRYQPSPSAAREAEPREYETVLLEALRKNRERDIGLGYTASGPHRDDLIVELDGVDLRKFGSAGQVRGAMVALKLAKLARLKEVLGESPIFLMDDFDSDLDEKRAAFLAHYLHEGQFQAIVATSKEGMIDRLEVPCHKVGILEGRIDIP
jgi:DNA replication and repair protein RecF